MVYIRTKACEARGTAGGKALKIVAENRVKENKKKLKLTLKSLKDRKVPLIKTELAKESKLSIATLNRSPYKEMINEYLDEEKALFSPKGKQEIAMLLKEDRELRREIQEWKEKYNRLKKEIIYSKQLF